MNYEKAKLQHIVLLFLLFSFPFLLLSFFFAFLQIFSQIEVKCVADNSLSSLKTLFTFALLPTSLYCTFALVFIDRSIEMAHISAEYHLKPFLSLSTTTKLQKNRNSA